MKIMLNLSEGFWKNDKKIGEDYQIRNYSTKMNKNCKRIVIIRNKILIYRAKKQYYLKNIFFTKNQKNKNYKLFNHLN